MKKVKRILLTLILLFSLFLLASCKKQTFECYFYIDDEFYQAVTVLEKECLTAPDVLQKESGTFDGWYLDDAYSNQYDFSKGVTESLTLYGRYLSGIYRITFETNGGSTIESELVERRKKVTRPSDPTKEGYVFDGWYSDSALTIAYDFNTTVNHAFTIYAAWKVDESNLVVLNYICENNVFASKDLMYEAFYGAFYDFMVNEKHADMQEIKSKEEFLTFCKTWEYGGQTDLYHVGTRYARYYVTSDMDGLAIEQPTDTFIGYCYQDGKFTDLIDHLIVFFGYWRTDEGYTNSDNHGNDFFYDSWAALVDTSKFFFFTSETLKTKYAWFTSARVKDALDNIKGCGKTEVVRKVGEKTSLQALDITGYNFEGFYLDQDYTKQITEITDELIQTYKGQTLNIYVKTSAK